jgi:hypothetical protein
MKFGALDPGIDVLRFKIAPEMAPEMAPTLINLMAKCGSHGAPRRHGGATDNKCHSAAELIS